MPTSNDTILDIILGELKKLDAKIDKVDERQRAMEQKQNYVFGFFAALGSIVTVFGQKLWGILLG